MGSKQRILEYLQIKGIGKRDFARDTGLSHTILNSGNNLGTDKLEKIISAYPDINIYWVVTGTGDMILTKSQAEAFNSEDSEVSETKLDKYFQMNFIKAISDDEKSREILTLFVKTIFNQEYAIKVAEQLMDEDLAKNLINSLAKSLEERNLNEN